jgi:hypothetical protein
MSAMLPGSPGARTDTADPIPGAWWRAEPQAGVTSLGSSCQEQSSRLDQLAENSAPHG